ncbi:MAG: glycosyltransferase [Candidatus Aureabacteria bacterium]|nr:glycosyltransferase [Candidatus Auribacterota bacterium]
MRDHPAATSILLLYVSIGDGHRQAALAIEEAVRKHHPSLRPISFDAFDLFNPFLVALLSRAYKRLSRSFPRFWNRLYDNDRVRGRVSGPLFRLYRRAIPRIGELIREFSPAAVVCTQAIPCGLVAAWKRDTGRKLPLVAVPTDYAVHAYWLFDEVDLYLVPAAENREMLLQRGVAPEKVRVAGIPIHPAFAGSVSPRDLKIKYGLTGVSPAVLLMGGGEGVATLEGLIREIDGRREKFQIAAVSGRNRLLHVRLQNLRAALDHPLRVFSFLDSMDELMGAADVIVTKPGGLTTAEALAKRVPMILVDPLPGQEELNAEFLERRGVALRAGSGREAAELVGMILNGSGAKERMRTAMDGVRQPESARVSADCVAGLTHA